MVGDYHLASRLMIVFETDCQFYRSIMIKLLLVASIKLPLSLIPYHSDSLSQPVTHRYRSGPA